MTTTPSTACPFVWYELMTSDAKAAQAFYSEVIGWGARDSGLPNMTYTLLSASTPNGSTDVGGMMDLPEEAAACGAQPGWMGYVAVPDVDAAQAQVVQAGGSVHMPADDIPSVGRFAVVADPQGCVLTLFKPLSDEQPPHNAPDTPGLIGWHELITDDVPQALAYYTQHFGWTAAEAMDMGPMGTYQMFCTGAQAVGGMMTKPAEVPCGGWLFYINVAGIDAAIARVKSNGGQLLNGPQQVPGDMWIAQCQDPQGAMFAMVGPKG